MKTIKEMLKQLLVWLGYVVGMIGVISVMLYLVVNLP